MKLSIEKYSDNNLADIARLNIELHKDEGSIPLSQKAAEVRLQKWLDQEYSCYIFYKPGLPVGYVLYRATDADTEGHSAGIFIRQFMIISSERNKGLGTTAFREFKNKVARDSPIVLDVMSTNPKGQRFWSALGFRQYSVKYELE
jgi:predicted acetyltransferase